MKDYIQIGIEKGLISLNEDKSRIKYIYGKRKSAIITIPKKRYKH